MQLKAVGCSAISILWQQAAFVKTVLVPYENGHVEGSLLLKYRDCTAYNGFELYLMRCGVILLLLIIYI